MNRVSNNYGNFFTNGSMMLKLCFSASYGIDNYAVFKRGENDYCIGHNCNFDFDNFTVSWCWGHYNYECLEDAKNWIAEQIKK